MAAATGVRRYNWQVHLSPEELELMEAVRAADAVGPCWGQSRADWLVRLVALEGDRLLAGGAACWQAVPLAGPAPAWRLPSRPWTDSSGRTARPEAGGRPAGAPLRRSRAQQRTPRLPAPAVVPDDPPPSPVSRMQSATPVPGGDSAGDVPSPAPPGRHLRSRSPGPDPLATTLHRAARHQPLTKLGAQQASFACHAGRPDVSSSRSCSPPGHPGRHDRNPHQNNWRTDGRLPHAVMVSDAQTGGGGEELPLPSASKPTVPSTGLAPACGHRPPAGPGGGALVRQTAFCHPTRTVRRCRIKPTC